MKKFIKRIVDMFSVRYCIMCNRAVNVGDDISICHKCIGKCGKFGSEFVNSGNTVVSVFPYIKNVRKAMMRFKFRNKKYYGHTFGTVVYNRVRESGWYKEIECITCVPMRNRDRLYNQAAVISGVVAEKSGIPFVEDALVKVKDNPPFYKLNRQRRLELIKGSFKAENVTSFKDKTVLLIDDIYTTGVTMNEAAITLLHAGAKKIYCATACYAVSKDVGEKIKM